MLKVTKCYYGLVPAKQTLSLRGNVISHFSQACLTGIIH